VVRRLDAHDILSAIENALGIQGMVIAAEGIFVARLIGSIKLALEPI
jgi:hypothetical protein